MSNCQRNSFKQSPALLLYNAAVMLLQDQQLQQLLPDRCHAAVLPPWPVQR
jgi:hypothetical protein